MNISKHVTVIPFLSMDEYKAINKLEDYNSLYLAKSEFRVIQQFLIDQESKPEKTKIIMLREIFEEAKRENNETLTNYMDRVKRNMFNELLQRHKDHVLIVVNAKNFEFFKKIVLEKKYFLKGVAVHIADIHFPAMSETMLEIHDRDEETRICPWAIPRKHHGIFSGVKIEADFEDTISKN